LPKVKKMLIDRRRKILDDGGPYDWGFAEALAFGSLLLENIPVRLSGQDSRRGTFGQRHAYWYDAKTGEPYNPLMHLAEKQARICVYNSLLSEAAVLGFDYGYSLDYPDMLCLWEAQFGDFANGAQTIIDQFIVSAESKWQRPSGIVLLLPHGYEGQGPEHSSGRLERFLQACAEDNIQVCNPTTPAQYFHVLRRQMKRDFIKPLIIMTPKSLLRAEFSTSRAEDFTRGKFHEIIPDSVAEVANPTEERSRSEKITRVIFCSGKVYFDLVSHREREKITNTAITRVEQLYPLDEKQLRQIMEALPKTARLVWCQEESQNMGAWTFHGAASARALRPRNRLRRPQRQCKPGCRCARSSQTRTGSFDRRSVFHLMTKTQRLSHLPLYFLDGGTSTAPKRQSGSDSTPAAVCAYIAAQ
jgi:2-oxoglutarate dehydrogenase E1 component